MSQDFTDLKEESYSNAQPRSFPFLKTLNLEDSVVNKVALNLNRIVSGSSEVYLTPIGKFNNHDELLSELASILDSKANSISENLWNLEQSNREKFGPRSIAKDWTSRKDSLYSYFEKGNAEISRVPINTKSNLRPLNVASASRYLKSSTSSGLPFYTNKGAIIDKLVENFKFYLDRKDPCILFTRTQEGGKTRNVWGYPVADTLNEHRYYQPLLNYQRKLLWRKALQGPHFVDLEVSNMFKTQYKNDGTFISIDFSAYDASIKGYLQSLAFDYIKSLFQYDSHNDLDYIADRFRTIGVITPDGVISGDHGVPSGATFTNEVDSIVQYLVIKSTEIDCSYQIQGDDGLILLPDDKVPILFEAFNKAGLTVNESKSYTSKDYAIFLQRLYDKKYLKNGFVGGIYSLYRALDRIVFQERYSDFADYSLKGTDYYSMRTITILENCKYHPCFEEFVRFIYSKDKYKLKFSVESIAQYDRMLKSGTGTTGLLLNQYGDNLRGIHSFETVKLIKSFA